MNLEDTKLDLSSYSEEERKVIVEAYEVSCGKRVTGGYGFKFCFCNPSVKHLTVEYKDFDYFKGHRNKEVKPIKKEEWVSINSLEDLNVGDIVKHMSTGIDTIVKFVGSTAYCENDLEYAVVHPKILSFFSKLSKTYTFEPVQDDTLAIKCFETYTSTLGLSRYHNVSFNCLSEDGKQVWRAVADLVSNSKTL